MENMITKMSSSQIFLPEIMDSANLSEFGEKLANLVKEKNAIYIYGGKVRLISEENLFLLSSFKLMRDEMELPTQLKEVSDSLRRAVDKIRPIWSPDISLSQTR